MIIHADSKIHFFALKVISFLDTMDQYLVEGREAYILAQSLQNQEVCMKTI